MRRNGWHCVVAEADAALYTGHGAKPHTLKGGGRE